MIILYQGTITVNLLQLHSSSRFLITILGINLLFPNVQEYDGK